MQMLGSRQGMGGAGSDDGGGCYEAPARAPASKAPSAAPRKSPAASSAKAASGFDDMDDDIPF
jgi:single-strand DNA-binding protein